MVTREAMVRLNCGLKQVSSPALSNLFNINTKYQMQIPLALREQTANAAWKAYAAHSYLYYVKNAPVIPDSEFDELCIWLVQNFDWVKQYDLNNYLEKDALEAGTGFNIAHKVCGLTQEYAENMLQQRRTINPDLFHER